MTSLWKALCIFALRASPAPAVEQALAPSDVDLAVHERDVASIQRCIEDDGEVTTAIDWPVFWARRQRLGRAAEVIEEPVRATVDWMRHEGGPMRSAPPARARRSPTGRRDGCRAARGRHGARADRSDHRHRRAPLRRLLQRRGAA
ncbi:hypothetical protein [Sorangium sp. So ce1153]|uniref:hypothetical protein n=1 Tax=Sorangium sp. So ce1153 TaxID=3133333 RepID=UPI003F5E082F